jgi:hypothetical protein
MNETVQYGDEMMKTFAPLALILSLVAAPVFANNFGFDLPVLTYPTDGTVTTLGTKTPTRP